MFLVVAIIIKGFTFLGGDQVDLDLDKKDIITIPVSEISENAKWYKYNDSRFFIIKADNGTIRTAFDACDVCYQQGKGYKQEGDYMVCNNCGLRFAINGIGTENKTLGGCWPSYLPHTIKDDNVIIEIFSSAKNQQSNVCPPGVSTCPVL